MDRTSSYKESKGMSEEGNENVVRTLAVYEYKALKMVMEARTQDES